MLWHAGQILLCNYNCPNASPTAVNDHPQSIQLALLRDRMLLVLLCARSGGALRLSGGPLTLSGVPIYMSLTWLGVLLVQEFEQTGTRLAQALTQKDSIARKKAAMSNDVAKALARLSSGLYVVTAAHRGGARGAMIASWVAQAGL